MNRNKIKKFLKKNDKLLQLSQYIYSFIFKHSRIQKSCSFGNNNPDETIFVIRPNAEDQVQGLMSLFIQSMRWIHYAKNKGYVPFIDFMQYKTQYYNGYDNIWDYFFTQPSHKIYHDVYKSKNVILSGVTLKKNVDNSLFRGEVFFNEKLCEKCHDIIWSNIDYSDEVKYIIGEENKIIHTENCLGLYVRGTDYIKLKPTGEYVQPEFNDVIVKVDEFLEMDHNLNIFLVTEDNNYYLQLKKKYKDKIKIVSFDSFISNYDGKNFLSKSGVLNVDKKKRGMDYLVKIALLAQCKYLVSSITMGSIAAYCLNGGKYEKKYIFDLGYYP